MKLDVHPSRFVSGEPQTRGGEMFASTTTSAIPSDVSHDTVETTEKVGAPSASVLITEQEVLFGTRVAISPSKASITRRMFDAVWDAARSLQLPSPRPHYPADMGYLEQSRMAREMERL
jgi:hypothetical protein